MPWERSTTRLWRMVKIENATPFLSQTPSRKFPLSSAMQLLKPASAAYFARALCAVMHAAFMQHDGTFSLPCTIILVSFFASPPQRFSGAMYSSPSLLPQ